MMMRQIQVILLIAVLLSSCQKQTTNPAGLRHLLVSHRWYYNTFYDNASLIPFTPCDRGNYLIFSEGGNAGAANDDANCSPNGKAGIYSRFTYTYIPDSNIIRVHNFGGDDYKWNVAKLNDKVFEIQFAVPVPPPGFAHNMDYTYSSERQ